MTAIVNCGHREYGYKKDIHGVNVVPAVEAAESKVKKYTNLALKVLMVIEVPLIVIDLFSGTTYGEAIPAFANQAINQCQGLIDLGPLQRFQHELWLAMLRGILYVSIPVYGWCGYIFAFAGQNAGKRTAAKWLALSMTGGIAFVAGAPWAGDMIYKLFKGIFHVGSC